MLEALENPVKRAFSRAFFWIEKEELADWINNGSAEGKYPPYISGNHLILGKGM
ncbi:hypothetical protein [Clostridium sp. Marseille-P3244]|uniref:hypothetical protein n=1 Tax=Clostridium sp. Marseille-P3244 TaxID=1871020 RepID=UPI000ADC69B3|nr:hypothetical protein [Clostridium sp. Marseille-P3244]